jgi:UDP-N-acetylglucosamine 2-epimerase (non-hydrolysing)
MSGIFLRDLEMPDPDVFLTVSATTHAGQTAEIMVGVEQILVDERPKVVVVFGDVNSTIAGALAAAKLQIPVAHVEAGLRSGDRSMPEEINRVLTDHLADLLFTTEPAGDENLAAEGIDPTTVHHVGNTMIDSLARALPEAESRIDTVTAGLGVERGSFAVLTLHRPSNVDEHAELERILAAIVRATRDMPVVFPVHPRTRKTLGDLPATVRAVDPFGYVDFLALLRASRIALTDSGGIQEETTFLGTPCVTLRTTTERPITITRGTNVLAGTGSDDIAEAIMGQLQEPKMIDDPPPLWDGRAAGRVVDVLASSYD